MIILKFGGTSLGSRDIFGNVIDIIKRARQKDQVCVVVSALSGTTDGLSKCVDLAVKGKLAGAKDLLKKIYGSHHEIIRKFVKPKHRKGVETLIKQGLGKLETFVNGLSITGEASLQARDYVVGHGEVFSAVLLSSALRSCGISSDPIDTRTSIVTDDNFQNAKIEWAPTTKNLRKLLLGSAKGSVPVITGFVGSTAGGVPTTLGRSSSDYTAAVVAAVINATSLEIWTDVDGVMSADPRRVAEVFSIPKLSYLEMMELAYFGAKVIHPKVFGPVIDKKIPIWIKNTFSPEKPGTLISSKGGKDSLIVKGITSIDNVAMITLVGRGLLGVPGMAQRFFSAFRRTGINIIMISQGSSEQNICCVIEAQKAREGVRAVEDEFEWEIKQKQIQGVRHTGDVVVVAAVGSEMKGSPGVAGRLFSVLGRNNVNVMAIAQGSSEMNISFVVSKADETRVLNLIHGAFHLSSHRINLFIAGKGTIGGKLLDLISEHKGSLLRNTDIDLKVVGIADSNKYMFDTRGLSLKQWKNNLSRAREKTDIKEITEKLWKSGLENLIFVDATANDDVARYYTEILRQGISVVTPNKKANTLSLSYYKELMALKQKRTAYYFYETSVGAGLPVISTLRDLLDSGDEVFEIGGVLSGTLSYIFCNLNKGARFSGALREAKRLGLTEPDPRVDLSGEDVARKILILAREIGIFKNLRDIKLEGLVPHELKNVPLVRFMRDIEKEDGRLAKLVEDARKKNCRLQYIGEIRKKQIRVGLRMVPEDSPFGNLAAGDNMVVFKTRRYFNNPLAVSGPGAGPDVTAAGILADIIKVAHFLRR